MLNTEAIKSARQVMIRAARQAGEVLKDRFGKLEHIERKGQINLVTEADKLSEKTIIGEFQRSYPDWGILSEEIGEIKKTGFPRFIIDPLDGTTNYAHNLPIFCVAIALEEDQQVLAGVVYDPLRDEMFTAILNGGAYLNGQPIKPSAISSLDDSLLVTGFPYDIRENPDKYVPYFNHLLLRVQALRRLGSAALDLCYVACGRFDGFWEFGLGPWDVAASSIIISEAGAKVGNIEDTGFSIFARQIMTSNGLIHQELRQALDQAAKLGR